MTKRNCTKCGKEIEMHGKERTAIRVKVDLLLCSEHARQFYVFIEDLMKNDQEV